MNSVNILGTLVADVTIKYLPSGTAIGNFSIAVNQDYKKDGQTVKKTSFFNCVSMGKQSEIISNFFHKGSRILISGELNQETWQDNNNNNREKVTIKVNNFSFVDKKSNDNQGQRSQAQNNYQPKQQHQQDVPEIDLSIDEVPF